MAGTTRGLTQLESPFGVGKADAPIFPQEKDTPYFEKALNLIQEEKKNKVAEENKKKEAQQKALDDFEVNYFIGHEAYFGDKAKEIKDRWVDLIAQGADTTKASDPRVAQLMKDIYDIKRKAKLSTDFGKMASDWTKMDEKDKSTYTKEYRQKMDEFLTQGHDFQKDIDKAVLGAPKAEFREAMPTVYDKEFVVTNFNKNVLSKFYGTPDELLALAKQSEDYANQIVENGKVQLSTKVAQFDAADDPAAARDKYLEDLAYRIKKPVLDKLEIDNQVFKDKKLQAWIDAQKDKISLGYSQERGRNQRSSEYKSNQVPLGKVEFAKGILNGDPGAEAYLTSLEFDTAEKDEKGKNKTTSVIGVDKKKGSEIQDLQLYSPEGIKKPDPNTDYYVLTTNEPMKDGQTKLAIARSMSPENIRRITEGSIGKAYENGVLKGGSNPDRVSYNSDKFPTDKLEKKKTTSESSKTKNKSTQKIVW